MNPVLVAASDRMRNVHHAVLVVAYGSFATETADGTSDIDLAVWAPVEAPVHDTARFEDRDLDAWIYPLDHRFDDSDLARVHPAVCLYDVDGRFAAFASAVAQTRTEALKPFDPVAKADLAAWCRKMVVRARNGTVEGHHRYHWLLSDGPELWCRFRDVPWEGPKKALARMREETPGQYGAYAHLLASAPDPGALEAWIEAVLLGSETQNS